MMRFSNQTHRFYCGVDLHARTLAVCVLDAAEVSRMQTARWVKGSSGGV
jgi:hypothetical protein